MQPRHIERTYEIKDFDGDAIEFLSILARKGGRLLRGGEPDLDGVAKMVINDFLRWKIPWFTPPPYNEGNEGDEKIEGREGRLGEMSRKRKRDPSAAETEDNNERKSEKEEEGSEDFEGFGDDDDDDESDGGIVISDDEDSEADEAEDGDKVSAKD